MADEKSRIICSRSKSLEKPRLNKKCDGRDCAFARSRPSFQSWGPGRDVAGNKPGLDRRIKPVYYVLPDPTNASLGQRIRIMRRSLGLTQEDLSKKTGVQCSVITRLERDKTSPRQAPRLIGRVLPALSAKFKATFPETGGDPFDFVYPPTSFGGWMRNLRARRGLKLRDVAATLGVTQFTVIRYENNLSKPDKQVRKRLRRAFDLNGELDRWLGAGNAFEPIPSDRRGQRAARRPSIRPAGSRRAP